MSDKERIDIAVSCKDCERVPKVANAGEIIKSQEGDYQIMHNGIKALINSHYGNFNVEVIRRLKGHHEPQEELAFHSVLEYIPTGGSVLELGCAWAYYSLWFLDSVKNGVATLVEPVASNLRDGKRNFALNNKNGDFINAAISNHPADMKPVKLWEGCTVEIETKSIDQIMRTRNMNHIDILHSDIQGAEANMLRGANEALRMKAISWLFISTHTENVHQKCIQILRSYGYHIWQEHTLSESYSVDGLIVACDRKRKCAIKLSKRISMQGRIAKWRAKIRVYILEPLGMRDETI